MNTSIMMERIKKIYAKSEAFSNSDTLLIH